MCTKPPCYHSAMKTQVTVRILKKLTKLHLQGNNLSSLSADVLSHLQRPLELGLFDPFFDPTPHHMMNCDADLCWLKQEEMQGTITWITLTSPVEITFKPVCAGGLDWDTWTCDGNGMSYYIKNYCVISFTNTRQKLNWIVYFTWQN